MNTKDATNRSAPEQRRCNAARGPGRKKGRHRPMSSVDPARPTRPARCPTCGHIAVHQTIRVTDLAIQGDYICTFDHPWIVKWMGAA